LAASGEEAAVRDRHAAHYLGVAAEAGVGLEGPDQTEWMRSIDRDYPNVRAALEWAHRQEDRVGLAAAAAGLAVFWASRGPGADGELWLDAALAGVDDLPAGLAARVLFARAWLAGTAWDVASLVASAERGAAIASEAGDERLVARFAILGGIPLVGAPAEELERAIGQARRLGDNWALTAGLMWAGNGLLAQDPGRARRLLSESVEIGRSTNRAMANAAIGGLAFSWVIEGDLHQARRLLEDALPAIEAANDRASAAGVFAWLCAALIDLGDTAAAAATADRLETVGREAGVRLWDSLVPTFRGWVALGGGDCERAVELAGEALAVGFIPFTRTQAMCVLAEAELRAGRHGPARTAIAELEAACREADNRYQLTTALALRAWLDRVDGNTRAAEATAQEALTVAHDLGARARMIDALEVLAGIAADQDSPAEAARLLGAAAAARVTTGYGRDLFDRGALTATVHATLGDDGFEAACDQGRALTPDEAVAYARRGRGERKRPSSGWASLTPMERQVVDLVRLGRTNPEIGAQLFVSPRTVQAHLSQIYTKLGVKGRTALAALPES